MRFANTIMLSLLPSVALIVGASSAFAQNATPADQSATPAPAPAAATTTNVEQAIAQSPNHTTLQKLIVSANLTGTLSGPGPITIFAPDDTAFGRLAPGSVDQLLDPDHAWSAKQIIKYHIVHGAYDTPGLLKQLKDGGGTLTLDTLDGQPLTLTLASSGAIMLTDAMGGNAYISAASDTESNGVIEHINGVLSPKMLPKPPAGAAGTTPDATQAAPDTSGAMDSSGDTTPAQDSSGA